jgi:CheY-like chemotaxis protein
MAKKKIMIVDDDKVFLEELQELLDNAGYEVIGTEGRAPVAEIANSARPDLILLDLRMPEKSGFEVATELKQFNDTADIPIIAMTGFYTTEERSFLMNFCGIKKCLKKPLSPLDVIKEIEWAMEEA